ncbi:MAG: polymer-forming cytoskeletal protein [Arenicellales bacterium]|nr:polymer-forming cytoskeletal protein [Arenicellales bacterium]
MTQKEIETPAAAENPNKPAASQAAPAAKTPDSAKANGRKPATIGPSIVIHGDVSGEEDLIVDGTVEGTVNFKDNNLVVSANGQVKANISARIIRIDGEVKGELHGSEQVVISPTGKVHGDIRAPRVVLEDGCTFRGSVEMETEKSPSVDRAATPRLRPTAARPVRPGREN